MRRQVVSIDAPGSGGVMSLIAYGDWGRPLLLFPSEAGRAHDLEDRGVIGAVAHLVEAGRVKLYCVDSLDSETWLLQDLPLHERALRHGVYESWIVNEVVPWIHADRGGSLGVALAGCSFGAYHSANFALKHADLFPLAICMSGVYEVAAGGWSQGGDALYFNNPMDYVANLDGDHLAWLRRNVRLVLVAGRGVWEDTTGALEILRHDPPRPRHTGDLDASPQETA